MKTIEQFNFKDKKALIRVDFNVPLNEEFEVTDNTRILGAKPTIDAILAQGGTPILMSHLGRPKNGIEDKFSLKHIVTEVERVLNKKVTFVSDCIGDKVEQIIKASKAGDVILLDNLRFYKEETAGDKEFASKLAKLADVYVNDAFGTAHRAHASTAIIADFFPNAKVLGKLLAKEIQSIDKVLNNSEKPVTAVLGGSKVSSKITIIENILDKVNHMIIGGGMMFTFIKATGGEIGDSIVENDKLELAKLILAKAKERNVQIHIPVDVIAADSFANDAQTQVVSSDNIPVGWQGLDVGPVTIKQFDAIIQQSKTILWNGPLGVFEMDNFAKGTINLGKSIAKSTASGAFSLVGGGDSVAAVKQFKLDNQVSYVSTGGGAMLEMLEGKTLPGIEAIMK